MLVAMILVLAFGTLSFAQGYRYKSADAWKFGVHGDTQWLNDDPLGENPNYVAVSLINRLNEEFINQGVKFVFQVGDLTDRSGDAAMATRAEASKTLYDANIGFFPMRGNHEPLGNSYGLDPDLNLNIPAYLAAFPQTQGLYAADSYGNAQNFGAKEFSSPTVAGDKLKGLSYAFDYGDTGNNARFVVIDTQETSYSITTAPIDATYGQGYYYLYNWWIVYKAQCGDDRLQL
jgi:hypothetical protein